MSNKKKAKKPKKTAAPKKKFVDPNIEEVYETEITFTCPVRGLVKQKVKVKRYKTKCLDTKSIIGSESDSKLLSQIDEEEDGLSVFVPEDEEKKEDTE